MISNKGGITSASSLPSVAQTQSFQVGDILVSNIRPYFKKYGLLNLMEDAQRCSGIESERRHQQEISLLCAYG